MEDKRISVELEEDLRLRISRIQKNMELSNMDALFVSSNSNIYYCAGRMFRGYVYVPRQGSPVYLVIRPAVPECSDAINIRKPEQIADVLAERGINLPPKVGVECDTLVYSDYLRLTKALGEREYVNASGLMRAVREVKTDYELSRMKEDGKHQTAAYNRISRLYTEGMTDIELQIEIERCLRLEGCLGFGRMSGNLMEINMGSVLCGDNADAPGPYDFSMGGAGVDLSLPVGADGRVIREGETVMVDMNGNFNGYQSDMTRVWSLGNISGLALRAHQVSIDILRKLETVSVPGFPVSEMVRIAYGMAEHAGLADYFMGHRQKAGFIGHGVGIELNEMPVVMLRSKELLEEGMTIALEPKFVIPGTGAVGVENTYIVTEKGLENITVFPEEILDLR